MTWWPAMKCIVVTCIAVTCTAVTCIAATWTITTILSTSALVTTCRSQENTVANGWVQRLWSFLCGVLKRRIPTTISNTLRQKNSLECNLMSSWNLYSLELKIFCWQQSIWNWAMDKAMLHMIMLPFMNIVITWISGLINQITLQ